MTIFVPASDAAAISETTAGTRRDPAVAVLSSGATVTVWTDEDGDGSGWGIKARLVDADGVPLHDPFTVNTTTAGRQGHAAVTALADGGFVVTWIDAVPYLGSLDFDIRAQVFAADGSPAGSELLIGSGRSDTPVQAEPAVTALAGGGFAIAWIGSDPLLPGLPLVEGRLYGAPGTPDGTAWSLDRTVADDGHLFDFDVSLSATADGGFWVGWLRSARDEGFEVQQAGAFAQHFLADGSANGAVVTIAADVPGSGNGFAGPVFDSLAIAAAADGGFVAAWRADMSSGGDAFTVSARGFDAGGTALADASLLGAHDAFPAPEAVDIDLLADGSAVVSIEGTAWQVDAAGAALGDSFAIAPGLAFGGSADVTAAGDSLMIAWAGDDAVQLATLVPAPPEPAEVQPFTLGANTAPLVRDIRLAATSGVGFDLLTLLELSASDPDVTEEGDPDPLFFDSVGIASGGDVLLGPTALEVSGSPGTMTFDFTIADLAGDTGTALATVDLLDATSGDDVLIVAEGTELSIIEAGDGDDALTGAEGTDYLFGGAGNDRLEGGAGFDVLTGGDGDDVYVADDDDLIIEFADGGIDRLLAMDTAFLGDEIEELELLAIAGAASGFGNALDNLLIGNDADNYLFGDAGNDILVGGGGNDWLYGDDGLDQFVGGDGDDNYSVDDGAELVFEAEDGGHDTVSSDASHYLYAHVEDLVLTDTAGDGFGVGNDLDNSIDGNAGSNLLIGGAGSDLISGHDGIDALFGESGDDTLLGGDGIDYLVGGSGGDTLNGETSADALYGEDGNDLLIGGSDFATDILVGGDGDDLLDGASGLGDYDLMDGGAGDDSYRVDTPDDLTFEAADGGIDTIYAGITGAGFYLYANTENLVLEDETPFGVGNELDNRLTGSAATNWLLGGAGDDWLNGMAGNDVLFGEAGADIFAFDDGTGSDVIGDFEAGTDSIDLSSFGFADFEALSAAFVENGGTTAILLGEGDMIVLNGVTNAQLTATDFILG
jgi:Ca2+-binding RTX toxin-like protein